MTKLITNLSLICFLAVMLQSCSMREDVAPGGQTSKVYGTKAGTYNPSPDPYRIQAENLALGNPSNAQTNATYTTNYLVSKLQYAMSYHRDQGKPNWVSWHLDPTWLGSTARQDNFSPDNSLPAGWYRVSSSSYTGSGFDRGHNCPSADRTYSVTDNSATFYMDNMMPQAPTNNQRTWAGLEDYARTLVSAGNECYIVAGSYGIGGSGTNGYKTTIDNGRVTVPARTWKAMLIIPQGSNDLTRISTGTRVIAVDMPNSNAIATTWGGYRTTVDAIEQTTGYNIFSSLDPVIQAVIESRVDAGPTQ